MLLVCYLQIVIEATKMSKQGVIAIDDIQFVPSQCSGNVMENIYIHTYTHTYVHAYIHTYIYIHSMYIYICMYYIHIYLHD